jgi:hypothetical protein
VRELLREAREQLAALYGARLEGMFLFGAVGSAVGLVIVLDEVPDYAAEIDRTGALAAALARRYEHSVRRLFVSRPRWCAGEDPFLEAVREDAVAA